ncbi:hypothetical protein BDV33DRAFT_190573 [Aspergillus novoparasiticus]|uniref:P-loop containing nucleoside triphosphate hydrolase protein n=1 Tax=Aspergillus novoparasiticus TaxID=986946 RepID=A0A5N6EUI1_9EURO|nr:hypothetical protein BDV33DRAFT_190573 [Aspergillus novoparasiticus]
MVDNVDISQVSLYHILCLFRGTLRSNLDPFGEYDDAVLAGALQAVFARESVVGEGADTEHDCLLTEENTEKVLDQPIADCGENLSHGQQQLLCLARAIATSPVDNSTDDLTQRSLRSALGQYLMTFLVIAHRLKTIADSDMVLDPEREMLENIILNRVE